MGKDKRQTQTTTLDPRSERFIQGQRQAAQEAGRVATDTPGQFFLGPDSRSIAEQIAPFMDPYLDQVIGGVRGEFDNLRAGASRDAAQAATRAGAFRSSRHGALEGARLGELDRAQASQVGGLLSSGFQNALSQGLNYSEYQRALRERQAQEPLFRQRQRLGFLTGGLGPTGSTTTQTQHGNLVGDIAGAGLIGAGFLAGGPAGAAAASGLGGDGGGNPLTGFGQAPAGFSGSIFDPRSARLNLGR